MTRELSHRHAYSWLYYTTVLVEYRTAFTQVLFLDCTKLQLNRKNTLIYTQSANLYAVPYPLVGLCTKAA